MTNEAEASQYQVLEELGSWLPLYPVEMNEADVLQAAALELYTRPLKEPRGRLLQSNM